MSVRRSVSWKSGRGTVALLVATLLIGGCELGRTPVIGLALSQPFLNAARLAVADAAAAGELPTVDTVLLQERTSAAAPALAIAQQLINTPDMAAVLGHSNSSASLATAPVYGEAGVLQLAPTSTSALYAQAGPFSFRMVPGDDAQARVIARTVRAAYPNGARVAIFYVNDDYGRGLHDEVRSGLDTLPWRIVFDMPHVESETRPDVWEQTIELARTSRPEIILWLGRAGALHEHLPALRRALPSVAFLGGDALSTWPSLGVRDNRWAGVQYVDFVDLDATPPLRAFATAYHERFGAAASGADALTYDAMRLLLTAMRDGALSGEALRRYLNSLGHQRPAYEGLTGSIAFTETGDVTREPLVLRVPEARRP